VFTLGQGFRACQSLSFSPLSRPQFSAEEFYFIFQIIDIEHDKDFWLKSRFRNGLPRVVTSVGFV
jgi:hypothetical protein